MKILIDADACPVITLTQQLAKRYKVPLLLVCDTNHLLSPSYGEVLVVGQGRDAVDFALLQRTQAGDLVVTQDYGLAAVALGKKARVLHHNGMEYTDDTIGQLLFDRYRAGKERRSGKKAHFKGPKKRTQQDNEHFKEALEGILSECVSTKSGVEFKGGLWYNKPE